MLWFILHQSLLATITTVIHIVTIAHIQRIAGGSIIIKCVATEMPIAVTESSLRDLARRAVREAIHSDPEEEKAELKKRGWSEKGKGKFTNSDYPGHSIEVEQHGEGCILYHSHPESNFRTIVRNADEAHHSAQRFGKEGKKNAQDEEE